MRLNERSSTLATVRTSNVLARPGTPVMSECPPTNSDSSTCSTTSSWPMIALRISRSSDSRTKPSLSNNCSSPITCSSIAIRCPLRYLVVSTFSHWKKRGDEGLSPKPNATQVVSHGKERDINACLSALTLTLSQREREYFTVRRSSTTIPVLSRNSALLPARAEPRALLQAVFPKSGTRSQRCNSLRPHSEDPGPASPETLPAPRDIFSLRD